VYYTGEMAIGPILMLVREAHCQLYDAGFRPAYHLPAATLVEVTFVDDDRWPDHPGSFVQVRTPGMASFWWGRWGYFERLPPLSAWRRLVGPELF